MLGPCRATYGNNGKTVKSDTTGKVEKLAKTRRMDVSGGEKVTLTGNRRC